MCLEIVLSDINVKFFGNRGHTADGRNSFVCYVGPRYCSTVQRGYVDRQLLKATTTRVGRLR